jgi:hypothetical protein
LKTIIRNILAFVAGVIALAIVKTLVIKVGGALIPSPPGVDLSTVEGFKAALPLFEVKHWVTPFLEHSLGSMAGAAVAALIAANHKMKLALGIGFLHLLGGIAATALLPFPTWVIVVDLTFAYIPMAWIGGKMGAGTNRANT